ncbi:hypothetical protein ITP53_27425 [Nonomuraea sp. K274]|uniref:Asp/Glu/hydantoin racemase n=1 Tax=Nonomuraea cypriaca TaxID=1187855 RepID=A0A931AE21_9ACTN|nr:hypothetical protein [Nonomuraea cypriaca]MBF8189399.1 hypothetical protein [Nonomuraea cypriaca]
MSAPRIALISATPAAIGPAVAGMNAVFPTADTWNLLDDKLLADATGPDGLTERLRERMRRLIRHALAEGASGVLLTCSMYGPVTRDFDGAVPVLAADEAAFAEVAAGGYRSVLVVASLDSARTDSMTRLRAALTTTDAPATDAADPATPAPGTSGTGTPRTGTPETLGTGNPGIGALGTGTPETSTPRAGNAGIDGPGAGDAKTGDVEVAGVVSREAFEATRVGDHQALLRALHEACAPYETDAVFLAQYSLAPVAEELSRALGKPVISGPQAAATQLKAALEGAA